MKIHDENDPVFSTVDKEYNKPEDIPPELLSNSKYYVKKRPKSVLPTHASVCRGLGKPSLHVFVPCDLVYNGAPTNIRLEAILENPVPDGAISCRVLTLPKFLDNDEFLAMVEHTLENFFKETFWQPVIINMPQQDTQLAEVPDGPNASPQPS